MLNIDLRSFLIGGLCTALFFLIGGFQKDANLGDIVVNSITILDDGHGGFITAYNEDQKRTLYLGTGKEKNGYVQTKLGRRRNTINLSSTNRNIREAEKIATIEPLCNYVCAISVSAVILKFLCRKG